MRAVAFLFGVGVTGLVLDRMVRNARAKAGVKEMVPDFYGNYDLDGVSYDEDHKKVVVGSDHRVNEPKNSSGLNQVECAEKLTG